MIQDGEEVETWKGVGGQWGGGGGMKVKKRGQ